jgi:hypothetical protein
MIVLLLALLYLPATSHCLLEQAGWFPSAGDYCEQTASAGNPQTSSCAYGFCRIASVDHLMPNPGGMTWPVAQVPIFELALALEVLPLQSLTVPPAAPPRDLPQGWQFAYRTALPPRAPSFVS